MDYISYEQYETIPKGKIASLNYKEKTSSKETMRRRKGKKLTQRKKTTKLASPVKKAESGMIVGKKYFIEDKTRRNNQYKVVYTGTYVGISKIENDIYLNFKGVKLLVNPFNSAGTATGFSPSVYKFIEQVE